MLQVARWRDHCSLSIVGKGEEDKRGCWENSEKALKDCKWWWWLDGDGDGGQLWTWWDAFAFKVQKLSWNSNIYKSGETRKINLYVTVTQLINILCFSLFLFCFCTLPSFPLPPLPHPPFPSPPLLFLTFFLLTHCRGWQGPMVNIFSFEGRNDFSSDSILPPWRRSTPRQYVNEWSRWVPTTLYL